MDLQELRKIAGIDEQQREQLNEFSATTPTFRVTGTYTDSAGKQQSVNAKVKAATEKEATKKAQQSLSKKYKDVKISQAQQLSENDQPKGTFTIVHGTSDPTHREERVYTIVENATRDQARKLAQEGLPKSEQDRYIIETTAGKYVPNGYRPNYINPEQQQKQQQKQKQQLDESTQRYVQQGGDEQHQWGHAKLYENMNKDRMLQFAGVRRVNEQQGLQQGDTVKIIDDKERLHPQVRKYAGKTGTVVGLENEGKFVHVKIKNARHGSMEFMRNEVEKPNG